MTDSSRPTTAPAACPLDYRYRPGDLARAPDFQTETLYVVGGLYGNPEALEAVLAMAEAERAAGTPVTLVFNGDFNWFNVDAPDFARINDEVLAHAALAGNVEAELARGVDDPAEEAGTGCGCAYPDYLGRAVAERSDRIFQRLQGTAFAHSGIRRRLAALPRHLVVGVGEHRVAVLHGDADSLSGWSLAAEALAAEAEDGVPRTPLSDIERVFREAGVHALATTHTCLPFAQDFRVDGATRLIVNNGSSGMPNFRGHLQGLLTRISAHPGVPPTSLYGYAWDGVRYDALPIAYDTAAWRRRFLRDWPPETPAHASYFERIERGPAFTLDDAVRGGVIRHRPLPLHRSA